MLNRSLLLLCIATLLCGVATSQVPQFVQASQFLVGPSPLAAASGDFNDDGKLDLVVTNKLDGNVSVLLGNGDGTFQPKIDSPPFIFNDTGYAPYTAAVADLNNDGKLDVAVTVPQANLVAVLFGNGDGTFNNPIPYPTAVNPQFIAIQDLDGKNGPDLVVSAWGALGDPSGSISVLMNSGAGTFPAHAEFLAGLSPMGVVIAHFTNASTWDVAVVNSADGAPAGPGTVSIMMGNGDGTFQTHTDLTVGSAPLVIAAANLDNKGGTDLVIGNFNDNTVSVLMGDGNGSFTAVQPPPPTAFGEPNGITIADFNGDGKPDLAVSNGGGSSVSILLGNGDGTFTSHVDYWAGNGPGPLVAADFNGDSKIDLAVPNLGWSNRADDKLSLLIGAGDGTFRSHVLYPTDIAPGAVATGDFNGDGIADLVIGEDPGVPEGPGCGCSKISLLLSNPDGTYQSYTDYPTGRFPVGVAVADFNGDGIPDVAVANYGTIVNPENTVGVLLGDVNGTLQQQVEYLAGTNPTDVIAADVNKDSKVDLIVTNEADNTVGVLLGNGDGSFQSQVPYHLAGSPKAVTVGDLNGDGILDLAVTLPNDSKVSVLMGKSDGSFGAAAAFATGATPVSVTIGDFNHDGNLDVATANQGDATISVLMGNGNGTLQPAVSYATSLTTFNNEPSSIVATDLNADGSVDLLVSSKQDNDALLFLGNGDGTFITPSVSYGTGWQPLALAVTDLNGDGAMDILSANSAARSVSVIVNAGGTFVSFGTSPANPAYGETITLTATAKASLSWKPAPTGDMSFFDGNSLLGSATLAGDTATFTMSDLGAGNHSLSAVYLGDTNFLRHASAASAQTINQATTTTALSSSANPSNTSQQVTFTATITPQYSGSPSGTITFLDGTTTIGTAKLAAGTAIFTTSALSAGSHDITATYGGDTNFVTSVSPAVTQIVNPPAASPDFQMAADAISAAMTAGQSATSTVTVTAMNGFSGAVALTCSVSPTPSRAPACSLNPASVTASTTGVTHSTLTIKTTAPQSASLVLPRTGHRPEPMNAAWLPILGMAFLGLSIGGERSRKHMLMGLLIGCLLVTALVFQLGCGGGSSSTPPPPNPGTPGTPAGAYTVTVTGTSGTGANTLTHQTTVTFTVQ